MEARMTHALAYWPLAVPLLWVFSMIGREAR
jgi:hypothetical protein